MASFRADGAADRSLPKSCARLLPLDKKPASASGWRISCDARKRQRKPNGQVPRLENSYLHMV